MKNVVIMEIRTVLKEWVKIAVYFFQTKINYPKKPVIKTEQETMDYLLAHTCSVSRFGDGEMDLICGKGNGFCSYNRLLAERLREVLCSDREDHILCLPYQIVSFKPFTRISTRFWRGHLIRRLPDWLRYTKPNKVYYCAQISRFYIPYRDKSGAAEMLKKWKELWKGKELLIVEGRNTRLGVGNDLFDQVKSVQRILCPSENAFEKYELILDTVQQYGRNKLILIALGQTATVLAYDLAVKGFWAIDIGHIDLEYEWFLRGVERPVKIQNKYVNEVTEGKTCEEVNDPVYQQQILIQL